MNVKKIFTNWRNILLLIMLILSVVAIHPNFDLEGVAIRSVMTNSSASNADIQSPKPTTTPMSREVITVLNNKQITDSESYFAALETIRPNISFQVKTNKRIYRLIANTEYKTTVLDELVNVTYMETILVNVTINGSTSEVEKSVERTREENKVITEAVGIEDIGLKVYDAPKNNIRLGLDLQGGTRVLLQPETEVSPDDMDTLLTSMKQRLNVYGLSDVLVREAGDLSGNTYILVEIAGANEEEVNDLLAKQGKFEAKIGNDTVFIGGKDITYVCRSADCSGIDPQRGCGQLSDGTYSCSFRFSISLTPDAAQKQADVTSKLDVVTTDETGQAVPQGNQYLSKKLDLILDDKFVDNLNIGADLKGSATTEIQISGGGQGLTEQEAQFNTLANMKRLQTILITGSLPVKINVVKTDSVSAVLGEEFIKNALFVGFLAILVVSIAVFVRYRKLKIAVPVIVFSISEVLVLLGVASLIGWNLDLAAIAGIIIVVGTSVDHQIVISDEILRSGTATVLTLKQKIKRAFFIILGAFFTTAVAMLPLVFAGAGLLKGFALTTMIGISIGVLVARPAFAATVEILLKD